MSRAPHYRWAPHRPKGGIHALAKSRCEDRVTGLVRRWARATAKARPSCAAMTAWAYCSTDHLGFGDSLAEVADDLDEAGTLPRRDAKHRAPQVARRYGPAMVKTRGNQTLGSPPPGSRCGCSPLRVSPQLGQQDSQERERSLGLIRWRTSPPRHRGTGPATHAGERPRPIDSVQINLAISREITPPISRGLSSSSKTQRTARGGRSVGVPTKVDGALPLADP